MNLEGRKKSDFKLKCLTLFSRIVVLKLNKCLSLVNTFCLKIRLFATIRATSGPFTHILHSFLFWCSFSF